MGWMDGMVWKSLWAPPQRALLCVANILNSFLKKLSRMNYFLVQLSTADILTTALTLFPEIGNPFP